MTCMLKVKIHPVKVGLALQHMGQTMCGIGGVSSISGAHGKLIDYTVIVGFFVAVAGGFFTTLFTNGNTPPPSPATPTQTVKP